MFTWSLGPLTMVSLRLCWGSSVTVPQGFELALKPGGHVVVGKYVD